MKVVQYLINEQHCDVNVPDKYGRTPLYLALRLALFDEMHVASAIVEGI